MKGSSRERSTVKVAISGQQSVIQAKKNPALCQYDLGDFFLVSAGEKNDSYR